MLSFVAGIVNIAGFLAVARLTTNVTGHFAFLVDEVFRLEFWKGFVYFLYIFFFFLGSFVSNLLVEIISRSHTKSSYTIPIFLESFILMAVAFSGPLLISQNPDVLAFALLFAMGLQNSLVTTISNATVRTTHLTGLFTDLGIELSQLFFYKETEQRQRLVSSIRLRLTIISFFFLGGVIGGVFYAPFGLHILLIGAVTLLGAIWYDHVKLRLIHLKRKGLH